MTQDLFDLQNDAPAASCERIQPLRPLGEKHPFGGLGAGQAGKEPVEGLEGRKTAPLTLGSMPSGESLRDAGANRALAASGEDWAGRAVALILAAHAGQTAIAEDFRNTCERSGLYAHHPNVWGALTLRMKRHGLLHPTGEWRSPKCARSHARPTRVYMVTKKS